MYVYKSLYTIYNNVIACRSFTYKKKLKKNKDSALMEEDEKNAFKKERKKSYS